MPQPHIRLLENGEHPSPGFIRRQRPIFPEFAERMSWFTEQEWERNGDPDTVYVWVLKTENRAYEAGHRRTRFCVSYRGTPRKNLDRVRVVA